MAKKKTITITRSEARALLIAMGSKSANRWSTARCIEKLPGVIEAAEGENPIEDEELAAQWTAITKAFKKDPENVVIVDDPAAAKKGSKKKEDKEDAAGEEEEKPKSKKKDKKAKGKKEDAEEDAADEEKPKKKDKKAKGKKGDDDDSSDADSKDDKKKDKKGKKKKSGPGVIATIIELLQGASKKKPITKKQITEELAKRIPGKEADSMRKTVNVQVPNRLKKDKDLDVRKSDDGYWIA